MDVTLDNWQERADELNERGGVPPRRAQVVALKEAGLRQREIAERLGLTEGSVSGHVSSYEDQREQSKWLLREAPSSDEL